MSTPPLHSFFTKVAKPPAPAAVAAEEAPGPSTASENPAPPPVPPPKAPAVAKPRTTSIKKKSSSSTSSSSQAKLSFGGGAFGIRPPSPPPPSAASADDGAATASKARTKSQAKEPWTSDSKFSQKLGKTSTAVAQPNDGTHATEGGFTLADTTDSFDETVASTSNLTLPAESEVKGDAPTSKPLSPTRPALAVRSYAKSVAVGPKTNTQTKPKTSKNLKGKGKNNADSESTAPVEFLDDHISDATLVVDAPWSAPTNKITRRVPSALDVCILSPSSQASANSIDLTASDDSTMSVEDMGITLLPSSSASLTLTKTSLPQQQLVSQPQKKLAHSFFAPRTGAKVASSEPSQSMLKVGLMEARLPTREEHGDSGSKVSFGPSSSRPSMIGKRVIEIRDGDASKSSTSALFCCPPSESFVLDALSVPSSEAITKADIQAPSPASSLSSSTAQTTQRMADIYAPKRAADVIASTPEARYLRDWLSLLAVQSGEKGKRKREVIRNLPKKKPKKKMDDWIVHSDDDEGEDDPIFDYREEEGVLERMNSADEQLNNDEDEDEDEDDMNLGPIKRKTLSRVPVSSSSPSALPDQPSSSPQKVISSPFKPPPTTKKRYPSLTQKLLHNAILLHGPPGSGKTSSVYACAEELGWEVFEVGPGTKRGITELARLLGGMASGNHMVAGGKQGKEKDAAKQKPNTLFAKLFQASASASSISAASGASSADALVLSDDEGDITKLKQAKRSQFGFMTSLPSSSHDALTVAPAKKVRQSLILLEEVDIIFAEDTDFWRGVIGIIGRSLRPIIMTCNDTDVLPLSQLSLQTTLTYTPPPAIVATPYLRNILASSYPTTHHLISDRYIDNLYTQNLWRTEEVGCDDIVRKPESSQPEAYPDLRRAICQLEMDAKLICGIQQSKNHQSVRESISEDERRGNEWVDKIGDWTHSFLPIDSSTSDSQPHSPELSETAPPSPYPQNLRPITALSKYLEAISFSNLIDQASSTTLALSEPPATFTFDVKSGEINADKYVTYMENAVFEKEELIGLRGFGYDREIATEYAVRARLELGEVSLQISGRERGFISSADLRIRRDYYQSQEVLPFLDPLVDLASPLLPSPILFTSYIPFIRIMVRQDDVLKTVYEAQNQFVRDGRPQRLSALAAMAAVGSYKPSYQRYIYGDGLNDVELELARSGGLKTTFLDCPGKDAVTVEPEEEVEKEGGGDIMIQQAIPNSATSPKSSTPGALLLSSAKSRPA